MENLDAKFWPRVAVGGPDECWEWTGGKTGAGYGQVYLPGWSGPLAAHRVSYEIVNGRIPDGKWLLHSCDNPGCVNPAHLTAGTPQENTLDSVKKGRWMTPKRRKHLRKLHGAPRPHSLRR